MMPSALENTLRSCNQVGRIGMIPFVTVGYPDPSTTIDIVEAIVEAGADVVELGVPFSDPLAEGLTIQRSTSHALDAGVTPLLCIEVASTLRKRGLSVPLVLMGYYNPILAYGVDKFCVAAAQAGIDGLIVADLPVEETGPLFASAVSAGLCLIPLIALTSTEQRIADSCKIASGFVYCVSVLGVTGARSEMSNRVKNLVATVKRHTPLPVAVGFGVSKPEHVVELGRYADAAVVGSALLEVIGESPRRSAAPRAANFISSLSAHAKIDAL